MESEVIQKDKRHHRRLPALQSTLCLTAMASQLSTDSGALSRALCTGFKSTRVCVHLRLCMRACEWVFVSLANSWNKQY